MALLLLGTNSWTPEAPRNTRDSIFGILICRVDIPWSNNKYLFLIDHSGELKITARGTHSFRRKLHRRTKLDCGTHHLFRNFLANLDRTFLLSYLDFEAKFWFSLKLSCVKYSARPEFPVPRTKLNVGKTEKSCISYKLCFIKVLLSCYRKKTHLCIVLEQETNFMRLIFYKGSSTFTFSFSSRAGIKYLFLSV